MSKQMQKSWTVVELDINPEHEDLITWLLIHHLGANGCQIIASTDSSATIQASFETGVLKADNPSLILAALDEYGLGTASATLRLKELEESDWLAEWKKGFKPLPIGERFVISPPWSAQEVAGTDRLVILIEPGLAFGTGHHATTQFCLEATEKFGQGPKILDVGTGSGILAIGAALLFAKCEITAVEIDPEACKVARENFQINNVTANLVLIEGSIDDLGTDIKFNTILSNLTCEDNSALIPIYAGMLAAGGRVIMSGILKEKLPQLEDALRGSRLKTIESRSNDSWSCVVVELNK